MADTTGLGFSLCLVEGVRAQRSEWGGGVEKGRERGLQLGHMAPLCKLGKDTLSGCKQPHKCAAGPVDGTFGLMRKVYPFF